jgi:S1-C subfamily serine protease
MPTVLQQLNTDIAEVVESAGRGLVQVHSGRRGTGAGTIWHPDGLIVTNAHVVGHFPRNPQASNLPLRVTLTDGRTIPARLLAHDTTHDLAALVVEANRLPTISLGKSRELRPGQWVLAMGHPWGIVGAVTSGIVIGVGPELPEAPVLGGEWIAVNLHLRPGYSGGPLLDVLGRLVGINTMMTGPSVGIAVPVHVVKAFLHRSLGTNRATKADA